MKPPPSNPLAREEDGMAARISGMVAAPAQTLQSFVAGVAGPMTRGPAPDPAKDQAASILADIIPRLERAGASDAEVQACVHQLRRARRILTRQADADL